MTRLRIDACGGLTATDDRRHFLDLVEVSRDNTGFVNGIVNPDTGEVISFGTDVSTQLAVSTSNMALSRANVAVDAVAGVAETANAAVSTANSAVETANSAVETANGAASIASGAVETANGCMTIINQTPPYSLPAATSGTLGGVKTGSNINISGSGVISVASSPRLSGNLTLDGTLVTINGGAGSWKLFTATTNNVPRWQWGSGNSAETGSNAGSDFAIFANADDGTLIYQALTITRSTGVVSLAKRPTFNGNLAWDSGNFNPGNYQTSNGIGSAYIVGLPYIPTVANAPSQIIASHVFPTGVNFPNGFKACVARSATGPTAAIEFAINKNGTTVGWITNTGGGSLIFNFTSAAGNNTDTISFIKGDVLTVVGSIGNPTPLAGLSITLVGQIVAAISY